MKKIKIRVTIGSKLVGLISLLLIGSVIGLVYLSTRMFIEDNTALIQQMNSDSASYLASQTKEIFSNLTEQMRVLGASIATNQSSENLSKDFFEHDKDFQAAYFFNKTDTGPQVQVKLISPDLKVSDPEGNQVFEALKLSPEINVKSINSGEVQVGLVKLFDDSTAIAVAIPILTNEKSEVTASMVGVIKLNRLAKIYAESDIVTNYLVDSKGKLLAHSDQTRVAAQENFTNVPVVKQLLEGKFNNGQTRYVDPTSNEPKLGAYRMVGFGGLSVVAEVPEAKALEAAKRVVSRSIFVAMIILSGAFFAGFYFSNTLTRPIKALVEAASQIAQGNFKINLQPKSKDEIAQLALAFNDMASGLEERDRVKETFHKFHNKEIAEKLLSGEVKLGGERRDAVIFFSDVRGFTGISETLEPEQVVEMLNEYMTRMVSVIRSHHGIVDKYVGDAIMALWGVPLSGENDVVNALRACIEMRIELNSLNELRISRGQDPLKIGMGLNMGSVIAGNIGSNEKMEYTVIGDAVNLSSRIESMTKEYGSDLLVSESIYEATKEHFSFEACKSMKVKGKSEAIVVYKVLGYVDEQGQDVIVETPYSSYASEKSDKVVHEASSDESTEDTAQIRIKNAG